MVIWNRLIERQALMLMYGGESTPPPPSQKKKKKRKEKREQKTALGFLINSINHIHYCSI